MDQVADRKFEQDHYEMVMLNTPATASKLGKALLSMPNELCAEEDTSAFNMSASSVQSSRLGQGASWTAFFNEGSATGNVHSAAKAFQAVHGRQPTAFELDRIRSFLSTPSASKLPLDSLQNNWNETASRPAVVQVTPVKDKKSAKSFSVYMEDAKLSQKEREQVALKWFGRFQKRKPSDSELENIRSFLTKDANVTDQKFQVLDFGAAAVESDDDSKYSEEPPNTTSSGLVQKKAAVGFTLNFDEESGGGDKEEAIRWFKRFNNRDPDEAEAANIASFVKTDDDAVEMVDIE